ncbi:hypothetical protein FOH10_21130 [Nocardia otitidiscaviarum]|uniref:Uncharacterized protein n=1 Tax=Nocardia otitidiscaviarum TaxID=1823 RepID=A0A516NPL7_9NOCA|nr:hypothetical protein [Nocardia otitidiscaviarum]MCP9623869.1 hypothetical protein [Nocardia otitidiscaviarum]QDP80840.1 hypothetical protein FOH10_21130 [Nocardia otitidiscaviarum]
MTPELTRIGIGVYRIPKDYPEDGSHWRQELAKLADTEGHALATFVAWHEGDALWIYGLLTAVHKHAASTIFVLVPEHLDGQLRAMTGVADVTLANPIRTIAYSGYGRPYQRPGLRDAVPRATVGAR